MQVLKSFPLHGHKICPEKAFMMSLFSREINYTKEEIYSTFIYYHILIADLLLI